jgi:hypothetical protein
MLPGLSPWWLAQRTTGSRPDLPRNPSAFLGYTAALNSDISATYFADQMSRGKAPLELVH